MLGNVKIYIRWTYNPLTFLSHLFKYIINTSKTSRSNLHIVFLIFLFWQFSRNLDKLCWDKQGLMLWECLRTCAHPRTNPAPERTKQCVSPSSHYLGKPCGNLPLASITYSVEPYINACIFIYITYSTVHFIFHCTQHIQSWTYFINAQFARVTSPNIRLCLSKLTKTDNMWATSYKT